MIDDAEDLANGIENVLVDHRNLVDQQPEMLKNAKQNTNTQNAHILCPSKPATLPTSSSRQPSRS